MVAEMRHPDNRKALNWHRMKRATFVRQEAHEQAIFGKSAFDSDSESVKKFHRMNDEHPRHCPYIAGALPSGCFVVDA